MKKLLILSLLGLSSCDLIPGYTSDWFGEEIVEKVIENETGVPLDLSPNHDHDKEQPFNLLKE